MSPHPKNAGSVAWTKVWDLPVRFTHWLVAAIVLWTYFWNDSGDVSHRVMGYIAVALVAIRAAWGVVGTGHGRFSAWLPTTASVMAYMRGMLRGEPERHVSHNPLGALMSLCIWLLIILLTVTGFLARTDYFWGDERIHDLHAVLANCLIACATLHVAAVVIMSMVHRENLIASMITGRKRDS